MKRILILTLLTAIGIMPYQGMNGQNTGPVAPEASSFEPVDATDMVNLVTGDFSYVLPLIEVPSPEGGFPMALSYHGGITMDQEASWVGLGWNITPGAINRGVNMFADDWNGESVYGYTTVDPKIYKVFRRSLYLPLQLFGLPSIGLNYTFGSHRSFGGSIGYKGASLYLDSDGNIFAGMGLGESPFSMSIGNDGVSIGYNKGISEVVGSFVASASVGLNYNLISGSFDVSGGAGLSYYQEEKGSVNISSVGFSIGSAGFSAEYKGVGPSTLMFGKLSSSDFCSEVLENTGGNFLIISWNNYKIKYWAYKEDIETNYGTLYIENAYKEAKEGANHISQWGAKPQDYKYNSDVYTIPSDAYYLNDDDEYDANENMIFPAYDNFMVSVQGMSGSITPRLLKGGLLVGNGRIMEPEGDGKQLVFLSEPAWSSGQAKNHHKLDASQAKYFYFDNEPVSYASVTEGDFNIPATVPDITWSDVFQYTGGELDYSVKLKESDETESTFFNSNLKRKGSSKPVEWFTNDYINHNSPAAIDKGFIDTRDIGDRSKFPANGIGGFIITDADGKRYHFALPVYQFEEVTRSYPLTDKEDFLERRNLGAYAYTWFLTAITGPDYVDVNNNGSLDDVDYGYWVKFNYGRWSDAYIWQMPYENTDKSKPYHWGRKQIYYLNSVETRTHMAYFVKSARMDGMGSKITMPNNDVYYSNYNFNETDEATGTCWDDELNETVTKTFVTKDAKDFWDGTNAFGCGGVYCECNKGRSALTVQYHGKSTYNCTGRQQLLKLDKIIIVNKNDNYSNYCDDWGCSLKPGYSNKQSSNFGSITFERVLQPYFSNYHHCWDITGDWEHRYNVGNGIPQLTNTNSISLTGDYWNSILDIDDIHPDFDWSKAIRVIKFNYDYSLCENTPNSQSTEKGKLTLNSINIYGRNMTSAMPPYVFDYYKKSDNKFSNDNKDAWGFDKNYAYNWNLKQVINPIGSIFTIKYESDKYIKEAVYNGVIKTIIPTYVSYLAHGNGFIYLSAKIEKETGIDVNDLIALQGEFKIFFRGDYGKILKNIDWKDFNKPAIILGKDSYSDYDIIKFNIYDKDFLNETQTDFSFSIPSISYSDRNPEEQSGGGVRVSEISVSDPASTKSNVTKYLYENGITTYAPKDFEYYVPYQSEIPSPMVYYGNVTVSSVNTDGTVVSESGKTIYEFETPAVCTSYYYSSAFSMGNQFKVEDIMSARNKYQQGYDPQSTDSWRQLNAKSARIINNTGTIGALKSVKTYNKAGDLSGTTVNVYKPLEDIKQGVMQETYLNFKGVIDWKDGYSEYPTTFYMVSSTKVSYPALLNNTDKILGSAKSTTYFDDYNFFTGNVNKTHTYSSTGINYYSESVPAYEIYPEMGFAYDNDDLNKSVKGKNMLSQVAYAINYKENLNNILSVSAQTWSNEWEYREQDQATKVYYDQPITNVPEEHKVWRKKSSFAWKGDIDTDKGTYSGFSTNYKPENIKNHWSDFSGSGINGWQKTSEITRYNHYSLPIEIKDINNHHTSTKTDQKGAFVIASASNASYNEFTYSGFEFPDNNSDYSEGEVKGLESMACAHTGKRSVKTGNGFGFEFFMDSYNKSKDYVASVWVKSTTSVGFRFDYYAGSVIVSSETQTKVMDNTNSFGNGEWKLFTVYIPKPTAQNVTRLKITGYSNSSAYFDDFKVQPLKSSMSCYVFDDKTGLLSAILDNSHFATKFVYDDLGKLKETYKETDKGFVKISEYEMNFKKLLNPSVLKADKTSVTLKDVPEIVVIDRKGFTDITYNSDKNWLVYKILEKNSNTIKIEFNKKDFDFAEGGGAEFIIKGRDAGGTYQTLSVFVGQQHGWLGSYFSPGCSGPIQRIDNTIDFAWGDDILPINGLSLGEYYAEWKGFIYIPTDGEYKFKLKADDYAHLFIDNTMVVGWDGENPQTKEGSITLFAGVHTIRLMYGNLYTFANVNLQWNGEDLGNIFKVIPSSYIITYDAKYDGMHGLNALYYNLDFSKSISRIDKNIYFNWDRGEPVISINLDDFGVQWSGYLDIPAAGMYDFKIIADDNCKMFLNGERIIDFGGPSSQEKSVYFSQAMKLPIRIEYSDDGSNADIMFKWKTPGSQNFVFVPEDNLSPSSVVKPLPENGLIGFYEDSDGRMSFRKDAKIAFNWGTGSPATNILTYNFRTYWDGYILAPETGEYEFKAENIDDNGSLYINNQEVYDEGGDGIQTLSGKKHLYAGQKYPVRIRLDDKAGAAQINIMWKLPSSGGFVTVPTENLFTAISSTEAAQTGLLGFYYDNSGHNMYRVDNTINFNAWDEGSPGGNINEDFSVEWNGFITPKETGLYNFECQVDDDCSLNIGGTTILTGSLGTANGKMFMVAGQKYPISITFYDAYSWAKMILKWKTPSGTNEVVPQTVLSH